MPTFSYITTGFSSGLGSIARPSVEKSLSGWHHILLCRNPDNVIKSQDLTVIKADLSSLKSVCEATGEIKALVKQGKVPPLKYIFNNAGVSHLNRTNRSLDGYEDTFQVNVIAVYFILKELIPLLNNQAGSRVFVTGSNVHWGDKKHNHGMVPKPYWNDKDLDEVIFPVANPADKDPASISAGTRAYATSKLGVIYLIHKFARDNKDIKFIIYEPGFVPSTGLSREMPYTARLLFQPFVLIFRLIGWSVTAEAAGTKLALCMMDDILYDKAHNVAYCDFGEITDSSKESYSVKRQDQLWKRLIEITV